MNVEENHNNSEYPIFYRSDGIRTRDSIGQLRPTVVTGDSSWPYGLRITEEVRRHVKWKRKLITMACRCSYIITIISIALGLKYG